MIEGWEGLLRLLRTALNVYDAMHDIELDKAVELLTKQDKVISTTIIWLIKIGYTPYEP